MPRYMVAIHFEVDTDEYLGVGTTSEAARELIRAMLSGEADITEKHEIKMDRRLMRAVLRDARVGER